MQWLSDFHFLRPFWFLAIMPLLYLCHLLWQQRSQNTGLEKHIDKDLLKYLSLEKENTQSYFPIIALAFIWLLTVFALAGPTWKRIPQALFTSESAAVVVLDLSPSMRAEDIKPSRIIRAHLKIQDFLSRRKDGLTALIVYAAEAYVVTPLTDDTKTISNLMPTLKPGVLPIPGSNTEMALDLASKLVTTANLNKASILLVTDNISEEATSAIKNNLPNFIELSILGIGTEEGSPIPNGGDFLKDKNGELIIAKRNSETLRKIAQSVNGQYLPMQNDTSDIDFYYKQLEKLFIDDSQLDTKKRQFDLWYEFAPVLLVILIPFIALFFRRGFIISVSGIILCVGAITPNNAHASNFWDLLWKNSDQRAAESYKNENYDSAAKQFANPQWQGSAHYKNKAYEEALGVFSQDNSAIGNYNRGNALAQLKRYDEAIKAYNEALEKDNNLEQAKINKEIVENLIKKKEEQNKEKQDNKENNKQENPQNNQQSSDSHSENQNKSQQSDTNDRSQKDNQENDRETNNEQQQNADDQKNESEDDKIAETNEAKKTESKLSPEEKQALEQWLRKVPDDPSGLLKRKFEYEYQKRRQLYQEGKWELPQNNAHQRY